MSYKNNILIVGPINKKNFKIYGGTTTSLKLLKNSSLSRKYNLVYLDTCPASIPPPNFFKKIPTFLYRILKYTYLSLTIKPYATLLFIAGPSSFFEKGIMNFISKVFNLKTFIFPRANSLISWAGNNKIKKFLMRILIKNADKIMCQGSEMRNFFIEKLYLEDDKTSILLNWTLTKEISNIGENKIKNFKNHNQKFLFIGWLYKEKGIYELINALTLLKKSHKNVKLYIAGGGKEYSNIAQLIQKNNLQENCKLLGWVNGKEKIKLLKKCDTLILPSYSEGFPNVIIESLGAGLSVVATSVGSIPSQLVANEEFIPIPTNNIGYLKNILKKLIKDSNLHRKISRNGFKKACKNYSLRKASFEIIKIIESFYKEDF